MTSTPHSRKARRARIFCGEIPEGVRLRRPLGGLDVGCAGTASEGTAGPLQEIIRIAAYSRLQVSHNQQGRSQMIEAFGLTKRYGDKLAVDDLTFTVPAGQVTGFLGPNGAGKSTTMRMVLGLDAPTSGSVTVNGRPYVDYRRPLLEVGALLEAKAIHDGRSAYNHLLCLAQSNGIARSRVDVALDTVGLREVARKRSGGFSLGMGQRLGIAAALLGDPKVLMFDEPVNGLDPEGVLWIRNLLKRLAGEGRTVFVSSHLMSEMSITADRLVIIGRGRLIAETTVAEFLKGGTGNFVRVRSPQADELVGMLKTQGITAVREPDGALNVTGATLEAVGDLAGAHSFTLHELSAHTASLEDTFMELTRDSVDFRTGDDAPALVPVER
jgi:ABC-2 type transport system ATP-binding protein